MIRWQHITITLFARLFVGLCLLLGLVAVAGGVGRPAYAATTLTVTDCSTDSQLQADVSTANSDNAGDTITFACGGTIPLTNTLQINGSMTLDGGGQRVILGGGHRVQVLVVNIGVILTLNALTIADGSAPLDYGGGLVNVGTVTISNSDFANNSASNGGGLANGIGGRVFISNSTFANNSVANGIGGGGIFNGGTVFISNSTFANNSAANGTGSFNGIGGGFYNTNGGRVFISNSTFANNSADNGGGLFNGIGGTGSISNSTFANNSAAHGTGGIFNNTGTVSIGGSIVANNSGGNCSGGVSDQGYNLESATNCGFTGTGDLQNTDPKLDPSGLLNNGGPTPTIALLATSPAIDHISAASCPATDQRGVTRPDDGETTCDIGAYESAFVDNDLGLSGLPANITTNATSPQGATVTYTPPTAVDESGDNPGPTVTCAPPSSATFAIGTTTVTCTATDSDDTNSPVSGSFQVVVNGAATQVSNLITLVNSFHLSHGLQTSLDAKLQAALTAVNAGDNATACSDLTDFISEVQAQSGKKLTVAQANQLLAAANQIKAVLGC